MKVLYINIHSFVDLITNSSSEIYIQATSQTLESIKEIINALLKAGGSNKQWSDLFEIDFDRKDYENNYGEELPEDDEPPCVARNLAVKITPKINSLEVQVVAELLGNLVDTYSIEEGYD